MYHRGGGGFGFMLHHGDENARPQVSRALLLRVLGYARPHVGGILLLLGAILATIGLGLLTPADLPRPDRPYPAGRRRGATHPAGGSAGRDSGGQRRAAHLAAQAGRHYRHRHHPRPAHRASTPTLQRLSFAVLHRQQGGRADEPAQYRRDRRPERGDQHHGGRHHQPDLGVGDLGGDAGAGVAAHGVGAARAAAVHPAGAPLWEHPADGLARADGAQRAAARDHERDPEHQRSAAGQAVRAAPRGAAAVPGTGGGGARERGAAVGGGQPLLHSDGRGHRGRDGRDLPAGRPPGDSRWTDDRDGGRLCQLPHPALRTAALAH